MCGVRVLDSAGLPLSPTGANFAVILRGKAATTNTLLFAEGHLEEEIDQEIRAENAECKEYGE